MLGPVFGTPAAGLKKHPTLWVLTGFHWAFTNKPGGFRAAVS